MVNLYKYIINKIIYRLTRLTKDVKYGKNVTVCPFTNLYGCLLDDGVFIGPFVEVQKNSKIGKNSRIQSHSFICEGVEIGENVFIGHNVNTINDRYPKNNNKDWKCEKIIIEDNCSIGTGTVLMAGITIGKNSLIGANSLVLNNVPSNEIWAGNPAKFIKQK